MKIPIFAASAALSLPLSAATLFQQDFEKEHNGTLITTSNTTFPNIAWAGYVGGASSATAVGATNATTVRAGALRGSGGPNGNTSGKNAYIFAQSDTTTATDLFFYISTSTGTGGNTFTSFTPSSYTTLNASWKSSATSFTTGSLFFALETGGSWYVSNAISTSTASPSLNLLTATWKSMTLSTAGAGSLDYNASSSFTYNDLFGAGQSVTGIGFYVDDFAKSASLATYRIDDLLISDIPETSTSLLGLIGFSALAFRRKK